MKKRCYAIKVGNNVRDIVVDNWEECKKYTFYYNSIYKGFPNEKQAKKWLKSFSYEDIEQRLKFQLKMKNRRDKYEKY